LFLCVKFSQKKGHHSLAAEYCTAIYRQYIDSQTQSDKIVQTGVDNRFDGENMVEQEKHSGSALVASTCTKKIEGILRSWVEFTEN
jgi:hypothetical protein